MSLSPGVRLGPYEILGLLGAGGMGEVYRARDTRLDRDVALKLVHPEAVADPAARGRLVREARTASALNHPHICTIYDVGEAEGRTYVAMEHVEGETLRDVIARGPLRAHAVVRYGVQLADALAHAHERGVVHRDLTAANIVITPEGRAKVLDFGLAGRLSAEEREAVTRSEDPLTFSGRVAGTIGYMAPEQLRGEAADARTDVWALGVVLYEALAGRRPFGGETGYALSAGVLEKEPAPLPTHIPRALQAVVGRCLEKEPGQRYQRASEVRAALEVIESGAVELPSAPLRRPAWHWPALAAGALLMVLAVLAFLGLNIGAVRERLAGGPAAPAIRALAVLPLANLMGDPDQEYLVAGMHDALIGELGQIGALSVISRTSVMRYRTTDKSVPEIARELNVDAVVEGSMFRADGTVRIQVRLVRALPMERRLWSQTYEGDLRNVLALQKQVARAITEQIQVTLTPQESARLANARPVNPKAYDAWAKGWFQFTRLTPDGLQRCLEYADAALAIDQGYAPAHALTANCANLQPFIASGRPEDSFPRAKAAALRALELDETLAEAHFALGWTLASYDWDWAGAERAYRRGLELNAGAVSGLGTFGWFLSWQGRDAEAMVHMERAERLNPASPFELQRVSGVHFVARRFDEAIGVARRATEMDPAYAHAYLRLGRAYTEKGMYEPAIAAFEAADRLSGGAATHKANLARAYALSGRREEARRILAELLERNRRSYVERTTLATIYSGLGEYDEALRWLEEAYQKRDGNMVLVKVNPDWDPLRADPRFQDLVRRMNWP